jgi:Na+-translocating ferredoxin:NAD+ oxidoreductase RnfD subunit
MISSFYHNNVSLFSTGSSIGTLFGLLLSLIIPNKYLFWSIFIFFMWAFYIGMKHVYPLLKEAVQDEP